MNFKYKFLLTVAILTFGNAFGAQADSNPESTPVDTVAKQSLAKTLPIEKKVSATPDIAKSEVSPAVKKPVSRKVSKKAQKPKAPESIDSLIEKQSRILEKQSLILRDLVEATDKLAFANVGLFGEAAGTMAKVNDISLKETQNKLNEFIGIFEKAGYVLVKLPDGSYILTTKKSIEDSQKTITAAHLSPDAPGKAEFMKALTAGEN